jgi:hypothetical protein
MQARKKPHRGFSAGIASACRESPARLQVSYATLGNYTANFGKETVPGFMTLFFDMTGSAGAAAAKD